MNVGKHRKKQKKLLREIVSCDELDDETLETYEACLHSEKKESGNAKVHKARLKYLNGNNKID
jgi:hypothetical protein